MSAAVEEENVCLYELSLSHGFYRIEMDEVKIRRNGFLRGPRSMALSGGAIIKRSESLWLRAIQRSPRLLLHFVALENKRDAQFGPARTGLESLESGS